MRRRASLTSARQKRSRGANVAIPDDARAADRFSANGDNLGEHVDATQLHVLTHCVLWSHVEPECPPLVDPPPPYDPLPALPPVSAPPVDPPPPYEPPLLPPLSCVPDPDP